MPTWTPLTGLLDRRSLYELVGRLRWREGSLGVVPVDLHEFKVLSDERRRSNLCGRVEVTAVSAGGGW